MLQCENASKVEREYRSQLLKNWKFEHPKMETIRHLGLVICCISYLLVFRIQFTKPGTGKPLELIVFPSMPLSSLIVVAFCSVYSKQTPRLAFPAIHFEGV